MNTLFEVLYSTSVKIDKACGDDIRNKRKKDLDAIAKKSFAEAVKLNQEKENI